MSVLGDNQTKGFDELNSREAPLGKSNAGRNNLQGVSYFYAASDVETACAEVKPSLREYISVAEFEITTPLQVIDLSNDEKLQDISEENIDAGWSFFFSRLMFQFARPAYCDQDYKLTQAFSDYFNKAGLAGIIYRSFYTGKNNITLFRTHNSFLQFINSRLLIYRGSSHHFWDFNNEQDIIAERVDQLVYDKNTAQQQLRRLKKDLQRNGK